MSSSADAGQIGSVFPSERDDPRFLSFAWALVGDVGDASSVDFDNMSEYVKFEARYLKDGKYETPLKVHPCNQVKLNSIFYNAKDRRETQTLVE